MIDPIPFCNRAVLAVALVVLASIPALSQTEETADRLGLSIRRYSEDLPGNMRRGRFTPFPLVVTTAGEAFEGEVWIRSQDFQRSLEAYRYPFEIGPESSKVLWPCFRPTGSNIEIELRDRSGKLVLKTDAAIDSSGAAQQIVAWGNVEGIQSSLSGAKISISGSTSLWGMHFNSNRDDIEVVGFPADALPDHWLALEFADAVILAGMPLAELSADLGTLLRSYAHAGGHVVLSVPDGGALGRLGPEWSFLPVEIVGSTLIEDLSPVARLDNTRPTLDTGDAFQSIPFSAAQVEVRDGEIVAGTSETPLVVTGRAGLGRVTFLNFDVTRPPFRGSLSGPRVLENLLAPALPFRYQRGDVDNQAAYLVHRFSPSRPVSLLAVVAFLGIYLLAVGPLNYFLLQRKKKLERATLTIPVLAVVFLGGAYAFGFVTKGTVAHLSQLEIAFLPEGDGPARVESFLGLYSPGVLAYSLENENPDSVLSAFRPFYYGRQSGSRLEAQVVGSDRFRLEKVQTTMWAHRYLRGLSLENGADLELTVRRGAAEGRYSVQVRSEMGDITNAALVFPLSRYQRLGRLPAGKEITREIQPKLEDPPSAVSLNQGLENRTNSYPLYYGGSRQQAPSDEIPVNIDFGAGLRWRPRSEDVVLFVGVLHEPLTTITVNDRVREKRGRTLVLKEVRLR